MTLKRLRALTALTLFLTFDLVLFGAFTRLTDSGLGCPDWPGCYGHASPLGAHASIALEQAQRPQGPVTHGKAWVEMTHRYLATAVGALITVLMIAAWHGRQRGEGLPQILPKWATLTFVWVCLQGAFGAWTVTYKLYPAIVTAHLLGGMGLLVLLVVQREICTDVSTNIDAISGAVASTAPSRTNILSMSQGLRAGVRVMAGLLLLQIALGAWVSTNDAVLACQDFPTCQAQWWPLEADFSAGFELLRPRGQTSAGAWLPFSALVAIHWTHRVMAGVVLCGLLGLAWRLWQRGQAVFARRLGGLALWQLASGVSNVVFGWPLLAALAHTAGAGMLAVVLTQLWWRSAK
jgi:cytochrome c oxidase assembly protein subunit 15